MLLFLWELRKGAAKIATFDSGLYSAWKSRFEGIFLTFPGVKISQKIMENDEVNMFVVSGQYVVQEPTMIVAEKKERVSGEVERE